jgi:Uncharacterised methyltransferase family (DUF6094)
LEVNVRNVARIKLGYYPLAPEEGKRLRKLLDFTAGTTSVVDPCVGTGDALHQLTDGAEVEKHGVELDANRAAAAAASGITTIHGDLFNDDNIMDIGAEELPQGPSVYKVDRRLARHSVPENHSDLNDWHSEKRRESIAE